MNRWKSCVWNNCEQNSRILGCMFKNPRLSKAIVSSDPAGEGDTLEQYFRKSFKSLSKDFAEW